MRRGCLVDMWVVHWRVLRLGCGSTVSAYLATTFPATNTPVARLARSGKSCQHDNLAIEPRTNSLRLFLQNDSSISQGVFRHIIIACLQ